MNLRFPLLTSLFIILSFSAFTQNPFGIAIDHLKRSGNYFDADLADIIVTDQYQTKHNGLTHVYLQQRIGGIEIDGATVNYNILEDGKINSHGGRFINNLKDRIYARKPSISATKALQIVLSNLEIESSSFPSIIEYSAGNDKKVIFEKGDIAHENIPARLIYVIDEEEKLRLSWELNVYEKSAENAWVIALDALNGEVLKKQNLVLHCSFGGGFETAIHKNVKNPKSIISIKQNASLTNDSYKVFAFPVESPNHGDRTLEVSPWDVAGDAGTLGWHDDGSNESDHTKGNNVDAYEDNNNSNSPTGGNDARADGGPNHEFDFTLDLEADPLTQQDPIITNLFYWNNILHDVMYQYGFDEESGNFQEDNLDRGGLGSDYVRAEAQDNINGSGNNANFYTPSDGNNPRMQMYLWDPVVKDSLEVNAPESVEGKYVMALAAFGGDLDDPLTGNVVEVDDGSNNPSLGCNDLDNGDDINGNIALIDRGSCQFGTKCLNAQDAGAIAVIVCNNVSGNPITMGGGNDGDQVTIPAVMIRKDDCETIRVELENGLNVTMEDTFSPKLDSDLDNGVITHEYTHGISNRLTGGAGNVGCLNNAEQMGEGWSDFYALWMTTQSDDDHNDPRGMGTYLLGEPIDGDGIRPTPYSTSFTINASTYEDIDNSSEISVPHGIGYLWCTMLWDLNWALINAHGYDSDLYNSGGSAGNLVAMQLIMDGLKIQPCSPGFEEGRDAILEADTTNNGGANGDIIWNVFARRGMGYSADQGSSGSRFDGSAAFDLPPDVPSMDDEDLFGIAPLPVELTAFIVLANNDEKRIELHWSTFSETNNKGFEIQRRNNNKNTFENIGWIDGAGDSQTELNYRFYDKDIETNDFYYYRLKQVDFDGTFSFSNIKTAKLNGLNTEIDVYPNPTNALVFIKLPESYTGKILLKVLDAKGRLMDKQFFDALGNAEFEINFTNHPEGIYFVKLEMQNGKVVTKRVVVKR